MDSIRLVAAALRMLPSREVLMRHYTAYRTTGNREALEALVAHYGYLALEKTFRLFHRLGDGALDLFQELLLEVVEVLNRSLDLSSKNVSFWVHVALERKLREHLTRNSELGSYRQHRLLRKLVAVRLDLEGRLGRAATSLELAQALGMEEEEVLALLYLEEANRVLSLSSPHPETGVALEDTVPAPEKFEDELEEALEKARLELGAAELSTLDRFLAGEEVEQEALNALVAALKARMVA